jgi:hypothetical protein
MENFETDHLTIANTWAKNEPKLGTYAYQELAHAVSSLYELIKFQKLLCGSAESDYPTIYLYDGYNDSLFGQYGPEPCRNIFH